MLAEVPSNNGLFDATNLRLLEELRVDARTSLAELGRRVGLSSPAVADRLRRLEDEGVITGYRVEVDPRALGYSLGVLHPHPPRARATSSPSPSSRASPARSSSATA